MSEKQVKRAKNGKKTSTSFSMLEQCEPRLFLSTTVLFREGGGTGYTDTAFDDATLAGTVDTADGSNTNLSARNSIGSNYKVSLLAVKDLFTLLPKDSGSGTISISSAKLHLFRYLGTSSDTIYLDRATTDWLPDSAGSSEADVTFLHRDKSANLHWAGGSDFSSSDYTTTNEVSSAWVDNYNQEKVLDITPLMQDIYDASTNYGIAIRTNASSGISFRSSEIALAYRPVIEITYDYVPTGYTLTVTSGTGDGTYDEDEEVNIAADSPATGMHFEVWTGDTSGVDDIYDATTTFTMPAEDAEITATYDWTDYSLSVASGTGDGSTYHYGDVINVAADAPATGMHFVAWTGDTSGLADIYDDTTTFTMSAANGSITATYDWTDYTLSVTNGTGDGATYHYGDVINVAADAPADGYVFDDWTGDTAYVTDVNDATTTFTMPAANASITATYQVAGTYTLTVSNGTGSGTYTTGDVINISATPDSGYGFYVWSSDAGTFADVNDGTTTFTMPDADVTVYANCSPILNNTDKLREAGGVGYTMVLMDDVTLDSYQSDTVVNTTGLNMRSGMYWSLLGYKDLFTLIPQTSDGNSITITSATLHLFRSAGTSSATVYVDRMLSNWLTGDAGTSEADVTYAHRDKSDNLHWASGGNFSSSDYTTTGEASTTWTSVYGGERIIDITYIMESIYSTGNNYGFVLRTTSTSTVAAMSSEATTVAYRPYIEITYTYGLPTPMHHMDINDGTATGAMATNGPGYFWEGQSVALAANTPPAGKQFNMWIGDVGYCLGSLPLSEDVTPLAQIEQVTPAGTIEIGDKFNITLTDLGGGNAQTLTVVATSTDIDQTCDDIIAAINASGLSQFQKVTASLEDDTPAVFITANTAGVPIYCTVTTTESDDTASDGQTFIRSGFRINHTPPADNITVSNTNYIMPATDVSITATYRGEMAPALCLDWWPRTDLLNKRYFGAEIEPLAYTKFGSTMSFEADGEYKYTSKNSAFLSFETTLPATTIVEWGLTSSYGNTIQQTDRYNYLHAYSLTDLSDNTTYHYRFVATDERGNTIYSSDKTLTTATPGGTVVYLSGGHYTGTNAFTLNQANTTYILTGDVTADYTAFYITANNVTLDLGGHTVTYNNVFHQIYGTNFVPYVTDSSFGVKGEYQTANIRIYNGSLVQGNGYNAACSNGIGYNPIYTRNSSGEVAGIYAESMGDNIDGLCMHDSIVSMSIHHNVILAHSGVIANRHQGSQAIQGGSPNHNLVLRHQQRGIEIISNTNVYDNEIYIDSVCTNSYGLFAYDVSNVNIYGNRVFGTGYMMEGIGTVSNCSDIDVYDNFVHLQAAAPDTRSMEYGALGVVDGVRIVWGGSNITYTNNVVSVYARDGGMARGLWVYATTTLSNLVLEGNICQNIVQDDFSTGKGAATVSGHYEIDALPIIFRNNRLISNYRIVILGESYGMGSNSLFYDNTLVKIGNSPAFHTIDQGYFNDESAIGHKFFDTVLEGGASLSDVIYQGTGTLDYSVGWSLHLDTGANAAVTIRDAATNAVVFTGVADASGDLDITDANGDPILLQFLKTRTSTTNYSYNIESIYNGITYNLNGVIVDELDEIRSL